MDGTHQKKQRVVVFTAGDLTWDEEVFLHRLRDSQHVDLVAVYVDQWKRPFRRIRFLMKKWGVSVFAVSVFFRALQAVSLERLWRKWHDRFVPVVASTSYDKLADSGVVVKCVPNINSKSAAEEIASLNPDLGVIVGGRILKDRITQIPKLGTLNIHKHDATKYRGSPQIGYIERLNDDAVLSVTIHFATSRVDEGDIVRMEHIPIEHCDDDRSLPIKAAHIGMTTYLEAIESVATGSIARLPQDTSRGGTYITTPFIDRLRFWRKYRKRADNSFAMLARLSWRKKLVYECYRTVRFTACMLLLPWLTRRRQKMEADGTAPIVMLYYHAVGNGGENWMTLPMHRLHEDITYLRKHFRIFSLEEAVERLRSGKNYETGVVLTFDDAYESCSRNLVPYLDYYNVPATIFACPGAATRRTLHAHDAKNGYTEAISMTAQQLADACSPNIELGSHGNFHENMGSIVGSELEEAVVGSADALQAITSRPVRFFSFPHGKKHHMSEEALERGRTRYDAMFSAYGGYNFPVAEDTFHFQRIANPTTLESLVAIMTGLHRMTPFYVDRPANYAGLAAREDFKTSAKAA